MTVKNHELAEKTEEISSLKAREIEVQRDVNKYRIDIMAFIKDIDELEKEIEEKDRKNGDAKKKIAKLTSDLATANTLASDAVKKADQKNAQLNDLVQKFFEHNSREVFDYDRKR